MKKLLLAPLALLAALLSFPLFALETTVADFTAAPVQVQVDAVLIDREPSRDPPLYPETKITAADADPPDGDRTTPYSEELPKAAMVACNGQLDTWRPDKERIPIATAVA